MSPGWHASASQIASSVEKPRQALRDIPHLAENPAPGRPSPFLKIGKSGANHAITARHACCPSGVRIERSRFEDTQKGTS
jgi:hypothetical protein